VSLPLVGTLTIGQAPRPDVAPIIEAHLPRGTRCLHAGVLDGLRRDEIEERFGHRADSRLLVTRLLDGRTVRLDGGRIETGVRDRVAWLEARGCGVIVILCTGVFRGLACERAWLVEPDRVIPPVVAALLGERRLGVVVPERAQVGSERGKWGALPASPAFAAATPYTDDPTPLRDAAVRLQHEGARAIVLDCIGFTERHRAIAVESSGIPVLLSSAIVARVTGELVASWGNG
jgi:protein AroM